MGPDVFHIGPPLFCSSAPSFPVVAAGVLLLSARPAGGGSGLRVLLAKGRPEQVAPRQRGAGRGEVRRGCPAQPVRLQLQHGVLQKRVNG